ncbi:MAG TPA: sugar porter family MFS transporter [Candidatus Acidoferrales bacterium]|nr:sugar porter family MFS transporter [Candidatus Acidoferrales bacterium]
MRSLLEKHGGAGPGVKAENTAVVFGAAMIAAVGGLLFGYDTAAISGAMIFIKQQFSLKTFPVELLVGMVLVGAAAAALGGGRLSDRLGRRATLLLTSVIFVVGALICAFAGSFSILLFGRTVVGLGIGLASTTVPVYISEVAPPKARGWQVSLFQLAVTVGILGAYLVDYAFAGSGAWRWMLGLAAVPGLLLGLGMFFLPQSPRWLARHGQTEKALEVLAHIRGASDVTAEFREIQSTLSQASEEGHWSALFSPAVRPALTVGIGLAVFQQITGINTVIYYAPTILQSAGISSAAGAILATAGIGAVNVIMTLVSMWLIDRLGRRPLLLTGTAGIAATLGILGFAFVTPSAGLAKVAVVTLMVYVASFAISLGPIFWLLISEIYPLKIRGLAEGTAAASNWAANLLVSLTFLTLVEALGPARTFWLYGFFAIGAWIFSYYLVPETKGRTLEEIERALNRHVAERSQGAAEGAH